MEFQPFPKIARLSRNVVITEKIDGTNASIYIGIDEDGTPEFLTGSRTRWITPQDDNYNFAKWADAHREELEQLGPGHHFGEWWGGGVQRNYGLHKDDKRFWLFNTSRWIPVGQPLPEREPLDNRGTVGHPPACCGIVPVLYEGAFTTDAVDRVLDTLRQNGSVAVPGFMKPEGVVVFHPQSRTLFKKTLEKDDEPKGLHK